MDDFLPIAICVILPVAIVLIVTLGKINADNKRAAILMKALESDSGLDKDKIAELFSNSRQPSENATVKSLRRGCLYSLIGIGLAITVAVMAYNDSDPWQSDTVTIGTMGAVICVAVGISNIVAYIFSRKEGK